MTRSFAPGEIILFGEHAVVYGRRSLAVSLSRGIETRFSHAGTQINISSKLGSLRGYLDTKEKLIFTYCSQSLEPFKNMIQRSFKYAKVRAGFKAVIHSQLPDASGLASSAAVSASFIGGLIHFLGKKIDKDALFSLVYKSEIDIQKRGSIIGSASAVYGGLIEVNKGKFKRYSLPSHIGTIIISDSQEKCPTLISTGIVKSKLMREPDGTNRLFDTIDSVAAEGKIALQKKGKKTLGTLFNKNQECLKSLGVSTKKIDRYLEAVKPFVYGSKITGAGGGGCVFLLVKTPYIEKVFRITRSCGMRTFRAKLQDKGITINGQTL